MIPLFVPATSTVILDYVTRYIHPGTGIVYGGTDYDDAAKIAEIGAVALRLVAPTPGLEIVERVVEDDELNPGAKKYRPVMLRVENPAAGFDAATWEIVDDPGFPGDKLRRPLTTTAWVITAADRTDKNALVDAERTRRLDILTVVAGGATFNADPSSRISLATVIGNIAAGATVPNPFTWRDATNIDRNLTPAQLIELSRVMMIAVRDLYTASWVLKDTTLPAITDAITFRAFDVTDNALWV
jgi:hypothetical protein